MASIKARASFIGLFHSPTIERDGQRAHAARVRVAGEYEPVPSIMTHAAVAVGAGALTRLPRRPLAFWVASVEE
jgi:hypothetical protein